MTILAVDTYTERRDALVGCLQSVFPDEKIVDFTDPMLAMKYSFSFPVDVVFTEIPMKRMGGFTLSEGVCRKNPNVKIFFLADTDEYKEAAITQRGCAGFLVRPLVPDAIGKIAVQMYDSTWGDNRAGPRLDNKQKTAMTH